MSRLAVWTAARLKLRFGTGQATPALVFGVLAALAAVRGWGAHEVGDDVTQTPLHLFDCQHLEPAQYRHRQKDGVLNFSSRNHCVFVMYDTVIDIT